MNKIMMSAIFGILLVFSHILAFAHDENSGRGSLNQGPSHDRPSIPDSNRPDSSPGKHASHSDPTFGEERHPTNIAQGDVPREVRQIGRQATRQAERQMDRRIDRRADRQLNRRMDRAPQQDRIRPTGHSERGRK